MKKTLFCIALCFAFFLSVTVYVRAMPNPNNTSGFHFNQIEEPDFIEAAEALGLWGYGTFVLTEKQCQDGQLPIVLDYFRKYRIIPIIRLATRGVGDSWACPKKTDIPMWTKCLSEAIWPVEEKLVVLFNEMNRAGEWCGKTDPAGYANIANAFKEALLKIGISPALGGFDSAAPNNPPQYVDEAVFIKRILKAEPDIFDGLKHFASHSYPNPGFAGSVHDTGRNSIQNYKWELALLKSLGVNNDFKVLITETGWPHREGIAEDFRFYSASAVAKNINTYLDIMKDPVVQAFTFFIFKDETELFDHFSWKKPGGKGFYEQYNVLKDYPKVKGNPKQVQKANAVADTPFYLVESSVYRIPITITNRGQAWWDSSHGYQVKLTDESIPYTASEITDINPTWTKTIDLRLQTDRSEEKVCIIPGIYKGEEQVAKLFEWCFRVFEAPIFKIRVGRLTRPSGEGYELLLYDKDLNLVFKKDLVLEYGYSEIKLKNVEIGQKYAVELVRPYHITQRREIEIEEEINTVYFGDFIPFDFDNDGVFSLSDILKIRQNIGK